MESPDNSLLEYLQNVIDGEGHTYNHDMLKSDPNKVICTITEEIVIKYKLAKSEEKLVKYADSNGGYYLYLHYKIVPNIRTHWFKYLLENNYPVSRLFINAI